MGVSFESHKYIGGFILLLVPSSRVSLLKLEGEEHSEYINANFIRVILDYYLKILSHLHLRIQLNRLSYLQRNLIHGLI